MVSDGTLCLDSRREDYATAAMPDFPASEGGVCGGNGT